MIVPPEPSIIDGFNLICNEFVDVVIPIFIFRRFQGSMWDQEVGQAFEPGILGGVPILGTYSGLHS